MHTSPIQKTKLYLPCFGILVNDFFFSFAFLIQKIYMHSWWFFISLLNYNQQLRHDLNYLYLIKSFDLRK